MWHFYDLHLLYFLWLKMHLFLSNKSVEKQISQICCPLKKLFCLNRWHFQLYGIFVGMLPVASGDKLWTWFSFSCCIWHLALNMCLLERACNKLCPILNSTLYFSLNYPDYQQTVRHHKTCPQRQQDHYIFLKLLTYPSPKQPLTLTCYLGQNVGFQGRGRWTDSQKCIMIPIL